MLPPHDFENIYPQLINRGRHISGAETIVARLVQLEKDEGDTIGQYDSLRQMFGATHHNTQEDLRSFCRDTVTPYVSNCVAFLKMLQA